jgi:hypothetical protein
MPSALFEIYQKNFDKTLKRLSGMLELYQNQTKEVQSITLKEIELNISEMERAISQMELEVILEKIPDNKKKLTKIIDNNKNIVKQYKREIQDLKYKDQSILNKKNLAHIPSNKKNKTTQLNFLKDEPNIDLINFNEDEDTALFIDKNNYKKKDSNNSFNKYIINDSTNEEMNLQKDEGIKRINEFNDSDKDIISKVKNNNIDISNKMKKNEDKDKDLESNKYKINKDTTFKKIMRIISNIVQFLITIIIAFCKNVVYKGYIQLKNYLNHRYGQANSRRIRMILFIIGFIIIYSFILYIWNSYKLRSDSDPVNLIEKNNTKFLDLNNENDDKNNTYTNNTNNTNINSNNTNNSNNTENTNISSNNINNSKNENTNNTSSINNTNNTSSITNSNTSTSTNYTSSNNNKTSTNDSISN